MPENYGEHKMFTYYEKVCGADVEENKEQGLGGKVHGARVHEGINTVTLFERLLTMTLQRRAGPFEECPQN